VLQLEWMCCRRSSFLQTILHSASRVQCGSHHRSGHMWFLGKPQSFTAATYFVLACVASLMIDWYGTLCTTCSSHSHLSLQVILGRGVLIHVAALIDHLFYGHPTALLYFVMVMCPLCMNLVQVCPAVAPGWLFCGVQTCLHFGHGLCVSFD